MNATYINILVHVPVFILVDLLTTETLFKSALALPRFGCRYFLRILHSWCHALSAISHPRTPGASTKSGCGSPGSVAANWTGRARTCTSAPKTTPRKKSRENGATLLAAAGLICGGGSPPWRGAPRQQAGMLYWKRRGLATQVKTFGTTTVATAVIARTGCREGTKMTTMTISTAGVRLRLPLTSTGSKEEIGTLATQGMPKNGRGAGLSCLNRSPGTPPLTRVVVTS